MHNDVTIIGGSFAGLAAATYLARGGRSVGIFDTGQPRNRFSPHSHGYLTQDGAVPATMLETARKQVAVYDTTTFLQKRVVDARKTEEGFTVSLEDGSEARSSRLILTFGISDDLPEIDGLADRWGNTVVHCPYCHGYELIGRKLGVLWTSPMSMHQATLIPEWGATTLFLNGADMPENDALRELNARNVHIEQTPIVRLLGNAPDLSEVELADGRIVELGAMFTGAPTYLNSDIGEKLGCELQDGFLGPMITVNQWQQTTVPGVFAAGDIVRPAHSVSWAVADGVMAGTAAHRSLVFPDLLNQ